VITDPTHTATNGHDIGLRFCQAASLDRADRWHADIPWSLSDWMTALTGEVGEAANIIKKLNRHRDGLATDRDPSSVDLYAELATELADVLAYLLPLASAAGVDLAAAFVRKFNTVSERQGWTDLTLAELRPTRAFD
jgi:NTP pyrophosphatase (non-canonical NTP hydrolase)